MIIFLSYSHELSRTHSFTISRRCLDFAGGLVVHLAGGVAGMVGTIALGPRLGRFDNDGPKPQVIHKTHTCTHINTRMCTQCRLHTNTHIDLQITSSFTHYFSLSLLQGHNLVLVAEGTLIIWVAFIGFNCGTTGVITNGISNVRIYLFFQC